MTTVLPTSTGESLPQALVRYVVRSSDVISDNRVNILEENSDRLVWYKESFLYDNEIVEHFVDSSTSTTLWTIHRPLRGWYIHLRASSFPQNTFIALAPVPSSSAHHVPAALFFSCRTLLSPLASASVHSSAPEQPKVSIDSDATLSSRPGSPAHTYPPPTPPAVLVSPPSPSSVHAKPDRVPKTASSSRPSLQLTTFLLSPHMQPTSADDGGFFSRMTRAFRNNAPALSNSFSLFAVLPLILPSSAQSTVTPISNTSSTLQEQTQRQHKHPQLTGPLSPKPVLIFRDTTPVFTVHQSSGVLELDLDEIRKLGVDVTFWIAVALAYSEFLQDRDGYLAAAAD